MADLLVVGSVALDSVETPFGKVREVLGGSATYFSYSASFFTQVRLVATVGEDFPDAHLRLLEDRGVDTAGLQTSAGRTFRWTGEYGALLMTDGTLFFVPAYPLESVYDPTGAGDTFAGGFMGYLAAQDRVDAAAMRRAIVYGTVMASFTVEDFSLKRLTLLKPSDIAERYAALHELIRVEP